MKQHKKDKIVLHRIPGSWRDPGDLWSVETADGFVLYTADTYDYARLYQRIAQHLDITDGDIEAMIRLHNRKARLRQGFTA